MGRQHQPTEGPDITEEDKSQLAWKRHLGHSIRVLNVWLKSAHYIQNQDTTTFYMRLSTQTIRSSGTTYTWPDHVVGINIDARGVTTPKDNPKIAFEYAQGFEAPTFNTMKNRKVTVSSFATGGAPPPGKAVKRLRMNEQAAAGQELTEAPANQRDIPIETIEDMMASAPNTNRGIAIPITPVGKTGTNSRAGSSTMRLPTAAPSPSEGPTPARQLTNFYGDANPPPPTPQDTADAHFQVSKSGRKLPAQGPREGSRNSGVEQHD